MIPNQTFTGALSAPFAATPDFTGTIDAWSGRLPPGLSIDSASGLISGTRTARGIFSATNSITGAQHLRAQKIARSDWGLKLAIKEDGSLFSWGFENYDTSYIPAIAPPSIANVVDVAVSNYAFLALKSDGTLVAWRETTVDPSADYITPPAGLSGVVSIAAGFVQFLALKNNGTVVAWGADYSYNTRIKAIPAGLSGVVAISLASDTTALALKNNGTVVAWGGGYTEAQIIAGGTLLNIPPEIADLEYLTSPVVAISISEGNSSTQTGAPDAHALALRADGSIIAWGDNTHGKCNVPTGLSNVVSIEALYDRSVALKSDGTLEVWGKSFYNSQFPEDDYTAPTDVVAVSRIAGGYHALKSDGTVVQVASNTGERGTRIIPEDVHNAEITYVIEKPASSFFHDGEENSNFTIQARQPFSAYPTFLPTFTSGESGEYFLVTENNWIANGLPPGLSINNTTGEISGEPSQLGSSNASITHIIGFNTPAQSSSSYSLQFEISRSAPVIKTNQTISLIYGESVVENLRNLLEDPLETYSDWSSWTVAELPSWAIFDLSNGAYIGTPGFPYGTAQSPTPPPERGTWVVPVTVTGVGGSDSGFFTLVVGFGPPVLTSGQEFDLSYQEPFSGQLTLEDTENRPFNGFRVLASSPLPSGLSINSSGQITGTPTAAGEFTAFISPLGTGFTSPGSLNNVDYESVVFRVAFGAPIITAGKTLSGAVGTAFSHTPALTDSANRPVTSWAATGLPSWATLNASTGQITGTPTTLASTTITLTATGPGGEDSETVTISIAAGTPMFAYPLLTSLQTGEQTSISPSITDAANRPITSFAAASLPAGLAINTSTGEITGAPTAAGSSTATITATGPGGSATHTIAFTVLNTFPIFAGAIRATAIYAGSTSAKAIYYGANLLWNVAGWEPSTLQNNLLAFYRLNDAGGGALSLEDSSGNNRTLTNTNATALSSGLAKGAASFTGSSQFLTGSIPFNPAQPYTISLWVNVSTLKNYFSIVAGSTGGTLNIHGDSSGGLSWNNGASGDFSQSGFFTANQWMHCVFVRGSANAMTVYKNGTLVKTATGSTSYSAISLLDIGNVRHMSGFQFAGKIDAVGVWNRALTTAEIGKLYNSGSGFEF